MRTAFFCAMLAVCAPVVVTAQLGRIDDRTEYAVLQGTGAMGSKHGPLVAIVLWRGDDKWPDGSEAQRRYTDSVYRDARRDAEDRGWSFFGSGYAYGLHSEDRRQLSVEGRTFEIVRTDSALVVMVSIAAFGLPRAVTTARIAADAVPEAFWPRTWSSGDTTFFVHPRYPRDVEMLRRALVTSTVVHDFLR
jgi:hypothetical protein